ncbi:VacB/RNase II family 3'-5' exoribonuclease [Pyxidicoccus fallax]|uniref:exoribonuclease II n=1 Tax=Pyxidicoccus fallax TaxID=394095 RepID=A0A848LME3_9BACT|nr:VacB/RNase II family 3'-5' exoribonuclease [Pyxidicoccus fallax]NMO18881.1 VacB/RNase II family 3'-5' exoribonuclease [Pyxidicoccus fallax]NPC80526.1 VacB/RNase II family 3'-5' exoribonuclease [Pyxidicoccus fallax]
MDTSASPRSVTGRIDVHPRGFGFLTVQSPGSHEVLSAFIPPPDLNPFFAGDTVTATITAAADGRWTASGLSLVERPRTQVYGEVVMRKGSPFLRVDREVANADWVLDTAGTQVQHGDAVVARIAEGKLVLLYRVEPGEDRSLERVIARHGLRKSFPAEVVQEALRARAVPHAPGGRRDLRSIPTVTVDAPSTRDIDDAISVLPAGPDGALRLLVSIADVGEFVTEGSALDVEARERATSVYLAGRVLPMLPEELSSHWLSLVQGEDRLCLTVELRIDPQGRVTAADVYESIIRSWARLNYDETAAFLDRGEVSPAMEPVKDVMPWFRLAAARLAVARAARGGMEFAREEARFTFDERGELSGLVSERLTSAHGMIERFMVAANEAIATWLLARGVPGVFRVHEQPDPLRVADLNAFAETSGFAAGFGRELTPLALSAFDRQIAGAAAEAALRSVLRRSLGPSRYTVKPLPHFGLAAPLYLHFTSPIRRYADLAVHRILKAYLRGRRNFVDNDPAVEALAVHINAKARAASRAETDRHRELEARWMAARVGQQFPARVTRVKPFGLVAQLDGMLVEGVVPSEGLPGGPFRPDARELSLVGKERSFTIGMPVTVKVASTDEQLGRVELALVP